MSSSKLRQLTETEVGSLAWGVKTLKFHDRDTPTNWNQIGSESSLLFEHKFFPSAGSQALAAGKHLDLGVNTGDNLEDALVGLVVVAGYGTILALGEDHAREGAR
jgi:hypothetical protein